MAYSKRLGGVEAIGEPAGEEATTRGVDDPLRQQPKQARGRAAVAAILDATSELLEESGFDSLTTATIARRAGVNIATLYRYYSNKFVIVRELAQGIEEERSAVALQSLAGLEGAEDWRVPVRESIRAMVQLRRDRPGARAIRRSLQSSSELWHLDHEVNAATAESIAPFLRSVNPAMSEERSRAIALTVVHSVASLLDLSTGEPGDRMPAPGEGIAGELELLIVRYLEPELDDL